MSEGRAVRSRWRVQLTTGLIQRLHGAQRTGSVRLRPGRAPSCPARPGLRATRPGKIIVVCNGRHRPNVVVRLHS